MARKSGHVFRGGRMVKRDSLWLNFVALETTIAAASTATLVSTLNAAALALRPFTIVRTRIHLGLRSDQSAAGESQHIAYGHIVVQDTASAIGVTAVPTPATELSSDFHMFEVMTNRFTVGSDTSGFAPLGAISKDADSKAMRKVDFGMDLAVVIETTSTSSGVIVFDMGRILIKLH